MQHPAYCPISPLVTPVVLLQSEPKRKAGAASNCATCEKPNHGAGFRSPQATDLDSVNTCPLPKRPLLNPDHSLASGHKCLWSTSKNTHSTKPQHTLDAGTQDQILRAHELAVGATQSQQIIVCAPLNNLPIAHHNDLVRPLHGRQPVGNHQHSTPLY